jgi:hypothetical protein
MDVCREKDDVKREGKSMDILTFDNRMRVGIFLHSFNFLALNKIRINEI